MLPGLEISGRISFLRAFPIATIETSILTSDSWLLASVVKTEDAQALLSVRQKDQNAAVRLD